ncbi:MAG: Crp/Fnr family transcriptional regulator [Caulobacteraceae bacterium]|jgi:CRP-like cAMP-binding protein|nr:Crp/Fnr family transcriptional regulator [Caulobacteraceae bacterium]
MLARMAPVSPPAAFAGGDTIYAQEDAADFIYEVIEGMVRTARLGMDGRRIVHGFFVAGDIFGLEPNGAHSCSAETVCAARIASCERSQIERRAMADRAVATEFWSWLLKSAEQAGAHMCLLARATAVEKIAHFLLEMAERMSANRRFALPMSRYDIADYLGLSSETVSRAFTALRDRQLIATEGRSVTILKLEGLRRLDGLAA